MFFYRRQIPLNHYLLFIYHLLWDRRHLFSLPASSSPVCLFFFCTVIHACPPHLHSSLLSNLISSSPLKSSHYPSSPPPADWAALSQTKHIKYSSYANTPLLRSLAGAQDGLRLTSVSPALVISTSDLICEHDARRWHLYVIPLVYTPRLLIDTTERNIL